MAALTNLGKAALAITRRIHRNQLYSWIMLITAALDGGSANLNYVSVAKASASRMLDAAGGDLAALKPGARAFVTDTKSNWFWDPTLTLAGDNVSVCRPTNAPGGVGGFVRETVPTFGPEWAAVATWQLDVVAGDDENDGTAAPLKTTQEFVRRIGYRGIVAGVVDVTITGTLAATDPYRIVWHFRNNGMWRTHGVTAVAYTNNTAGFTARTVAVESTNTPNDVTDPLVPTGTWTGAGLIGKRIRATSGANVGAISWAIKDLAAAKARISSGVVPTQVPGASLPAVVNYAAADQFVVETLPTTITHLEIDATADDMTAQGATGFLQFVLFDSCTIGSVGLPTSVGNGIGAQFNGCDTGSYGPGTGVTHTFVACKHAGMSVTQVGSGAMAILHAGYVTARMNASFGCSLILCGGTIAQGATLARVRLGGTLRISDAAAFDSGSDGLLVETGGFVRCDATFTNAGSGSLWGAGNTASGINLAAGSRIGMVTLSLVTITGVRDFAVAGQTSGRPFDNTAGAYAAAATFSWANLAAATPGGFGTRFSDPVSGAELGLN